MRAETGPMRFGDDWTGVFLRGDYAGPMAMYLRELLDGEAGEITRYVLRGFADTLENSDERNKAEFQQMKPFEEARST